MVAVIRAVLFLAAAYGISAAPPEPVAFTAQAPVQGVVIVDKMIEPIMRANIDYLLTSFDVNHMLQPFRQRAGQHAPPGARPPVAFWDTDLLGSNAGRFLMGAGNTLRWIEDPQLRTMMDEVVEGVATCRNASNGYIFAFPPENFLHSEQGDYGRSWFTQGMIEAGKAGNNKVWPLLRGTYDWFNDPDQNPYLPYLYDAVPNGEQGQIASTRMYLETPVGVYKDSQVAQDTYRDNLWMRQLIARDPTGISDFHMPAPNHAHCYEITSFLSMFDNYRATHNTTWLEAAMGAWELIAENFVNIDGTSALTEGSPNNPAKSYPLVASVGTGETCCTTFWIKFNQRFHNLRPDEERYMSQIETAIYNALLRQMGLRPKMGESRKAPPKDRSKTIFEDGTLEQQSAMKELLRLADEDESLPPGIRYHAPLQGVIELPRNINTCCEGQGTRAFGSLPEYIYSLAPGGVYVNLFTASHLKFNISISSGSLPPEKLNEQPSPESPSLQPSPGPPMSWRLLESNGARDGAHCSGSVVHGGVSPPCPKNVESLEECKGLCLSSEQPNICMGLTWRDSSPPQLCETNCMMVDIPAADGTGAFHLGVFDADGAANITTLAGCQAVCLAKHDCVQVTWERLLDRCVLYSEIESAMSTVPGAAGWVKCAAHAKNSTCAHISPGPSCVLYRGIDLSTEAVPVPGIQQWMVEGRRVPVKIDYNASLYGSYNATQHPLGIEDHVLITLDMDTEFPSSGGVSMRLSWSNASMVVPMKLWLRMPSWLSGEVTVNINGKPHAQGKPASYLAIDRTWSMGDVIALDLAPTPRFSLYEGVDQVKGYEGKRYALVVGPIVLACVGPMGAEGTTMLPVPAGNADEWLIPTATPLHFNIKGASSFMFKPLWAVENGEPFTTYPIYIGSVEKVLVL